MDRQKLAILNRQKLAILKAKALAYDCLEAWQPFHFHDDKAMVGLKDPAKFARAIALVYRFEERYKNERTLRRLGLD